MKRFLFALFTLLLVLPFSSCRNKFDSETAYSLIPLPYSLREGNGEFEINNDTRILISGKELESTASRLQQTIEKQTQIKPPLQLQQEAKSLQNVILLSTVAKEKRLAKEGYRLMVDRDKVVLSSNDEDGIFYAVQTLIQLFDMQRITSDNKALYIPSLRIWDEPRFSYRGMHLDVSRHFFDVKFIKHYLDLMAYYKFNRFHWHLTDDQGWRIEIKSYPKLTEVGAWRTEKDGSRYGGFYTQDEIKEVVAYAKKLHITIIPEIEMPGHSRAALAAYPELSCTAKPKPVPNHWGVFKDIYCAGNEKTFDFIENVLDEVIALFPGEYIHIGGDEVPKDRWENCQKCQARMKKEGLQNEAELQSYFIKRISKYLASKGRKLMGWDEILEGGLAKDATVMSWRGMQGGIKAARMGNQVVMTPGSHCYFDHYQADKAYEPKAIGGYLPLKKVFDFEPVPKDLFTEQKDLIIGAQANVWTEYMAKPDYVEYMILPRMLALSEVLWSKKENKNWDAFQIRLQDHFKFFDKKGYRYSKGTYRLSFKLNYDSIAKQNRVTISSEQFKPRIYYTLNGLEPDTTSFLYQEPIKLGENDSLIRAGIFENGKRIRSISSYKPMRK
jgi:hexosaminidase